MRIEEVILSRGGHLLRDGGVCAMEAVSWLAGEAHSQEPKCACPVITRAVWILNDSMPDAERNRLLIPLLHQIATSKADPQTEVKRALIAADWAARVFAPISLMSLKSGAAYRLRELEPLKDWATAARAVDVLYDIPGASLFSVRNAAAAAHSAVKAACSHDPSTARSEAMFSARSSALSAVHAADWSPESWPLAAQMIGAMLGVRSIKIDKVVQQELVAVGPSR